MKLIFLTFFLLALTLVLFLFFQARGSTILVSPKNLSSQTGNLSPSLT